MFRKITSLVSFFSIIIMALTSIILYVVPQGRVAYWANWKIIGLSKDQWGNIHVCTGVLFLVASILHIWLNWKPIMAYLKKKGGTSNFSSPAFFISIIITLYVVIGSLVGMPPMAQVLDFSANVKDQGAVKYGIPPYGHAELSSIEVFCKRMGLDLEAAIESIKKAGVPLDSPKESIKNLAYKVGLTPKELHEIILKDQPGKAESGAAGAPVNNSALHQNSGRNGGAGTGSGVGNEAGAGLGRLTLEQYCERQKLDLDTALGILREKGAVVDKNTTIREIAGMLDMNSPREIGILLHP